MIWGRRLLSRVWLRAGRYHFDAGPVTIHLQDMNMMGEAVEKRAREPFRTEQRGPFVEWQGAAAGDAR